MERVRVGFYVHISALALGSRTIERLMTLPDSRLSRLISRMEKSVEVGFRVERSFKIRQASALGKA